MAWSVQSYTASDVAALPGLPGRHLGNDSVFIYLKIFIFKLLHSFRFILLLFQMYNIVVMKLYTLHNAPPTPYFQ